MIHHTRRMALANCRKWQQGSCKTLLVPMALSAFSGFAYWRHFSGKAEIILIHLQGVKHSLLQLERLDSKHAKDTFLSEMSHNDRGGERHITKKEMKNPPRKNDKVIMKQ